MRESPYLRDEEAEVLTNKEICLWFHGEGVFEGELG